MKKQQLHQESEKLKTEIYDVWFDAVDLTENNNDIILTSPYTKTYSFKMNGTTWEIVGEKKESSRTKP